MLKPGMFIGDRYEIIDKVGSGGMADVYKAKCHRLNRYVAIKVLKPEFSDDKNFVKKFRGEAQSAAGLSHPNIVNVYDVGDDNGLHYIVMELVEGITLKKFIERKGKLDVKEAVGIAIQIAMGLEAAHANHIIHRDIKPQNIIISKEGKVKVTDFGIAKAINSNTITSNAMGSVHYLSPEQARGGYSDEKSDIYSLGVTLYEMLSGQVPFAGNNTVSVALLHIQGEATPLREIDPNIPLSLEKIVQKCMQKKPERRYLSATELIADLKRSITNPNGDFVVIPSGEVSDSPTITISDEEVNHIKSAAKINGDRYDVSKSQNTGGKRIDPDPDDDDPDEDEDMDKVDPRVEKIVLVGSIAAGVILTILIIFFVVRFFKLFPGSSNKDANIPTVESTATDEETVSPTLESKETVMMPSVVGLLLEDAKKTLYAKSESFNVTYNDEEYSDKYEKGMVIEQYPAPNAEVEADSEIRLVISLGPEPFKVPNVYNLTDNQAVTKLEEAGLVVVHDYAYSDEIEEGRVIETIPSRDESVVKGDTVTVVISNGPEIKKVEMPNIIGLTESKAVKKLENAGLTKGEVTKDYSDTYPAGQVISQSIKAGKKVDSGTAVDFVISLGPDESEKEETQTYIGHIEIDENPFDYPGDAGMIKIQLIQDGKTKTILKEYLDYDSFPLNVGDVTSTSGSKGKVVMYVGREVEGDGDGVVYENGSYIKYEEYGTTWQVKFTPVN
ncbi:MAG: non-specific serine/threonine protein kinase [Lachnoclostridium sp.]|jgi:eukaryotic-like serine/threonine-protein kinase